jgi:hypothetical protein
MQWAKRLWVRRTILVTVTGALWTALNDVGLISDAMIASQFAKLREVEIPSHAPFQVVGILVHDLR